MKAVITALAVLSLTTTEALAQSQTLSARPGQVNYVEGEASLNGSHVDRAPNAPLFVGAGDIFSTAHTKAELLLMPGVFLRLAEDSEIQMLAPSLVDTRLELRQGEAIIEAVGIIRGSQVIVTAHGAEITVSSNGLYRIRAGQTSLSQSPSAGAYSGNLEVSLSGQALKVGKGHQILLEQPLKAQKMDLDEGDELYAWSSVRSQYEAAASYQAGLQALSNKANATGWYFYDSLDTWAWLPRQAFFSPFGWGYYPASSIAQAPIIVCSVMRGGHWANHPRPIGGGLPTTPSHWVGPGSTREVPINPRHLPVVDFVAGTPRMESAMRSEEHVSIIKQSQTGISKSQTTGTHPSYSRLGVSAARPVHNQVVRVSHSGVYSRAMAGGGNSGAGSSARASSGGGGSVSRGVSSGSAGHSSGGSSGAGHSGGGSSSTTGGGSSHK